MNNNDLMSGTIDRSAEKEFEGQAALMQHVENSLDEGISVPDIKQNLISEKGFDEPTATSTLVDTLKPRITSALETHGREELRSTLSTDYGYDDNILSVLFDDPDAVQAKKQVDTYEPIQLVPIAETNSVTEEDLEDLTASARNVHMLQMPLFKGMVANMLDNEEGKLEYTKINMDTSTKIANTLRKLGKNVIVSDSGALLQVLENGSKVEIDEGILDSIFKAEYEIFNSMLGGYAGYKAVATFGAGLFGGKFGWLTKFVSVVGGAAVGSGTFSSVGRSLDILSNAIRVKEGVDAQFLKQQMVDAGVFTATAEIIGTPLLYGGAKLLKGIGTAFIAIKNGNTKGGYKALKDLMHLDDNQVKEIIIEWERMTDSVAPGKTLEEKALHVIPQTEYGGEAIISQAASMNPKASSDISKLINDRANSLINSAKELTNDNISTVINDDLKTYMRTVKDNYTGIKAFAIDAMKGKSYSFDYKSLALEPIFKAAEANIRNPAILKRFQLYVDRIQQLGQYKATQATTKTIKRPFARGGPKEEVIDIPVKPMVESGKLRSFKNLLELRKVVNEFKYNTKIRNALDYDALNSVLYKIDREISTIAKEHMPNGDLWLIQWNKANKAYAQMIALKGNVLYKALVDTAGVKKGINPNKIIRALSSNITAIDGTFMEVLNKLPPKARSNAEGAVLDHLISKYTVGEGFKAIHFPKLVQELEHVAFTTQKARELKRVISNLAKIFKNDIRLQEATGKITIPSFQSYLTVDPMVRLQFEVASQSFNYIRRLMPTNKGKAIAMVTKVAKVMENPKNAKAIKELINILPDDPELASSIHKLSIQYAKFGETERFPKVQVFRTTVPGSTYKNIDGKLGKGIYWTTDEKAAKIRSSKTGAKVISDDFLPRRIAVEQNVKDILGVEHFDFELLKDSKNIDILKERGYQGFSHENDVIIFK